MIELLVALGVLSLVIVSTIEMKSQAYQATQSAYWHNQAVALIAELNAMMRSNSAARHIYTAPRYWQTKVDEGECDSVAEPCESNEARAQADISRLKLRVAQLLPFGDMLVEDCGDNACVEVVWNKTNFSQCQSYEKGFDWQRAVQTVLSYHCVTAQLPRYSSLITPLPVLPSLLNGITYNGYAQPLERLGA